MCISNTLQILDKNVNNVAVSIVGILRLVPKVGGSGNPPMPMRPLALLAE
jgi:hypothetical protein